MILSSEEIEILTYLKSWNGQYVPVLELCRRAGGRRKYEDDPHWAKSLVSRLVDANLVDINERGHYRYKAEADIFFTVESEIPVSIPTIKPYPKNAPEPQGEKWLSPEIATILKQSGRNPGEPQTSS